jgi:hypothetical protein
MSKHQQKIEQTKNRTEQDHPPTQKKTTQHGEYEDEVWQPFLPYTTGACNLLHPINFANPEAI